MLQRLLDGIGGAKLQGIYTVCGRAKDAVSCVGDEEPTLATRPHVVVLVLESQLEGESQPHLHSRAVTCLVIVDHRVGCCMRATTLFADVLA